MTNLNEQEKTRTRAGYAEVLCRVFPNRVERFNGNFEGSYFELLSKDTLEIIKDGTLMVESETVQHHTRIFFLNLLERLGYKNMLDIPAWDSKTWFKLKLMLPKFREVFKSGSDETKIKRLDKLEADLKF